MIIGIDLGTTNSLAAYFTPDGPKLIPNRLGTYLTPSVVSIDEDGQVYVGQTAKERALLYPESTASAFKRSMGSDRKYILSGREYRAEELSSFVLKVLKEDAEIYLKEPVTEAVISVPAYFNEERRRATKRAGELAGLKVGRIISEPTAAAVAYGLYECPKNARFLVFDLGGGTFDVSILELFDQILEVRAVAGDNFLGGEDFTMKLMEIFCEKQQLDMQALTGREMEQLRKQANEAKHRFSDEKTVTLCFVKDEETLTAEIGEKEYEAACETLLEKIRQPVKRSLADAGLKLSDIDNIVLIGGATRMPMIRRFVTKLFRRIPDWRINPDEAVALGAAVQAAMKERNDSIREVILTDVCPFTLGTEVSCEIERGRYEGGHYCPIIERNTVIPASRTERLCTLYDHQRQVRIHILQGESRLAQNNVSLGELLIDVPDGKAGEEAVDVTYTYDVNALLEVEVRVVSTGKTERKVIRNQYTKMTDEEIAKRFEELSYLKIHPRDQEENKLWLLRGERLYEESLGNVRIWIEQAMEQFERALETRDQEKIRKAREEFIAFLKNYEDYE